ncbi:MAG: hypothetical protein DRP08_04710, partial [Candidatus Aenigmatarchaeota archaeon]
MARSFQYASIVDRAIAAIVDGVIIGFAVGIIVFIVSFAVGLGAAFIGGRMGSMIATPIMLIAYGIAFLLSLGYYIYFEGTSGQTIGKKLLNIRVVKEDGSPCDFNAALMRNILRIVDALPTLYILGIILMATSPTVQRLGDRVAHTVVIKEGAPTALP